MVQASRFSCGARLDASSQYSRSLPAHQFINSMAEESVIHRAVREGRFEEALGLLETVRVKSDPDHSILRAELLLYRGRTSEAVSEAKRILTSSTLTTAYKCRALSLMAEAEWHSGHPSIAIEMTRRA